MQYEIRESKRARAMRIAVHPDGRVVVTRPARISSARAQAFLDAKREWVEKQIARFSKRGLPSALPKLRRGTKAYQEAIHAARKLVEHRLPELNAMYGFRYGTISIRNQKTRWGSCSPNGNLSFNYRIIYLPTRLQDYLMVHELSHLKEHNHSSRFWSLVAQTFPDHPALRRQLRTGYLL